MTHLVQMHHMVPPSFDHRGSFQAQHGHGHGHSHGQDYFTHHQGFSHYQQEHQGHQQNHQQGHQEGHQPPSNLHEHHLSNLNATPRSFPSRSTQPTLHRITTTFHRPHAPDYSAEHSLRRKTPRGTIDNGYDGSLTHLASGPPPLKQMALPGPSRLFPGIVDPGLSGSSTSSNLQHSVHAGPWPYSIPLTPGSLASATETLSLKSGPVTPLGWGAGPSNVGQGFSAADCNLLAPPIPQFGHYTVSNLQPLLGPGYYNQSMTPGVYSPAALPQPAAYRDGVFPDFRNSFNLGSNYAQPSAVVDSAFVPPNSAIQQSLPQVYGPGHAHSLRLPFSVYPFDDGFSHYSQGPFTPHATYVGGNTQYMNSKPDDSSREGIGEPSSPAHFKDRALHLAHRAYNDLVLYLNHLHHGEGAKPGSRHRIAYPRPPRTLTLLNPQFAAPSTRPDAIGGYPQYSNQSDAASRPLSYTSGHSNLHSLYLDNVNGHQKPGSQGHYYQAKLPKRQHEFTSPPGAAKTALNVLSNLCEQSGWKWVDGMLLGGCLHYALERYDQALEWFRRVLSIDQSHVEAISHMAATLYSMNRPDEAEQHWTQAVKKRPSYLEAVESLVNMLIHRHKSPEAVKVIDFVQRSLRMPSPGSAHDQASETGSEADTASTATVRDSSPDPFLLDGDKTDSPETFFAVTAENSRQPGFGSSGYAIPGSENGRMISIIHAKGNILYSLKNIDGASKAFEEAVLISAGRQVKGLRSLIRLIQSVLNPGSGGMVSPQNPTRKNLSAPLLLPPERAKHIAKLVFATSGGHLPGLQYVVSSSQRRSAVSTTSNALLSLAKILQDAMSNGGSSAGVSQQSPSVGDILALYYLSLSLQESPSTANNVGILLASVQLTASQQVSVPNASTAATIPGIVPGSGLALALAYYQYGLTLDPKHVHLHTNLGSLLKDIGQLDLAISMYEKAVACDGTFDIALTNLANAVKDRGRTNDAIIYYKRAVTSNPDFAEAVCGLSTALNSVCDWRGRGGVLLANGRYDQWHVDENGLPEDVTKLGRGSGLMQRVVDIVAQQLREASAWGCGVLQEQSTMQFMAYLRAARAAVADGSLDLDAELRKWSGRSWEGSRVLRLIERATRATMRSWYRDRYIHGTESASGYARPRLPATLTVPTAPTVLPFHTFTCPLTAKDVRMISQRNALRISCSTLRSSWIPATVYEPPRPPSPQLNVGYVSSDFNNHPLAHLMQSVFGFHDNTRVRAFCYATTASDKSIHRQQIEREAPVFRDVSTWSSDRLVQQIVADGIHILVNLNGYTRGARNEVFAARPAPIQMAFMGFAGTLGAEWCDYLLADTTSVPPSTLRPHRNNLSIEDVFRDEFDAEAEDWVYSENLIYCKDTFFCCDHKQSADGSDERGMTWEEEQRRRWNMRKMLFPNLPDDRIILGNFNQLYKIDPTTFRTWLRILAGVPKAVLWLLRFPELGENNLRRTAKLWAGDEVASRIIFTDVAPKQQHIARARVCDLFLDTPECNAHTTAADVLWSSTPLLTLPRYEYKMCSRMAASILKGALPKNEAGRQAADDLIAGGEYEYENRAIKLANGLTYELVVDGFPMSGNNGAGGASAGGGDGGHDDYRASYYGKPVGRLAELRKLLWESKWTCALFDTRRWVRDLENAYDMAWQRWVDGVGGDIYL
ncbi:glycosyl transferase family 41-domain-containing protein [Pseudoneurospora amorphoporcata]|uniref:protein O-GlcNAc transferase n=1 Tax=Pseudoneurospora amorphoporcata TaxID=241081 RepID=A0AAN6NN95_9PEZI|nr:glycosyl transferase family 41-domain-containing protein [Pseudoneurospora amorphoporcata]